MIILLWIKTKANDQGDIPKVTGDFQCFVCWAIFSNDEDRKQHLDKQAYGKLRNDETTEEKEIAKEQEELEESHPHHIWQQTFPHMQLIFS